MITEALPRESIVLGFSQVIYFPLGSIQPDLYIQIIYFDSKISCISIYYKLNSVLHNCGMGNDAPSIPEIMDSILTSSRLLLPMSFLR